MTYTFTRFTGQFYRTISNYAVLNFSNTPSILQHLSRRLFHSVTPINGVLADSRGNVAIKGFGAREEAISDRKIESEETSGGGVAEGAGGGYKVVSGVSSGA